MVGGGPAPAPPPLLLQVVEGRRHAGEGPRPPCGQDQLSMASAMALNYCCTAVCVRDYIKQGLGISCLDYK